MHLLSTRKWPIAVVLGAVASFAILGTALAWPDILEGRPKNLLLAARSATTCGTTAAA